jgi:K+-transporting ATPase KdpF subunit
LASLPAWRCSPAPARGCERCTMFELILGGAVAIVLFVYLAVALLAPEKF